MNTTENIIGSIVRKRRQETGLSQEQIATLVGCEVGTISRIERGTTDPSYQTVKRLKEILNISGESLFQEKYYGFKEEFKRCLIVFKELSESSSWRGENLITVKTREKHAENLEKVEKTTKNQETKKVFCFIKELLEDKRYLEYLQRREAENAQEEERQITGYRKKQEEIQEKAAKMKPKERQKFLGENFSAVGCVSVLGVKDSSKEKPEIDTTKIEDSLDAVQIEIFERGLKHNSNIEGTLRRICNLLPED